MKKGLGQCAGFLLRHWPAAGLLLILLGLAAVPHKLERLFVYYPVSDLPSDPAAAGLAFEDVFLETGDGVKIHGWFVPREGAHTTLLIFHGNAGNIGHRVVWIDMLHRAGAHAFIIDYRGYGRSGGAPHEQGLYRDADAALEWWRKNRSGPGEKLVLFGESLGGAVAVDLAARAPVDGLILQSTFSNARDMAKGLMPLGLLQPLLGIRFDSESKIRSIRCPKLFLHGEQDEIVPFRLGRKLFEAAPEPKRFWAVPRAGHNDLVWVAGAGYLRVLSAFLRELERPSGGGIA